MVPPLRHIGLYQRMGVATYWVVDPESRVVEIWRPGEDRPDIATETLLWRVTPEVEDVAINLDDVFARG